MLLTERGGIAFAGISSALFIYHEYPMTYESGLSGVPQIDAHTEV